MTRGKAHIAWPLVSLLLVIGCAAPSIAQTGPVRVPVLSGHRFIASDIVEDPFGETFIVTQLGGGVASDLDFPLFEVGGDTIFAPRGDLLFAVLKFEYRQRIKRWLSVNGAFKTIGRLGTEAQSLLLAGVTASSQFDFEWIVTAHRSERSALAVGLGFRRASTTNVDLFRFVEDVVGGEEARLVDTVPSVQSFVNLRYARALSRLVGMKVEGGLLYGEQTQSRESGNELNWRFGLSLSVDPREKLGIPVGVLASYAITTLSIGLEDAASDTQEFELKIEYTAPSEFSIGPSLGATRLPATYQDAVWFVNVLIASRYYF
jgi:hypothetical protein